MVTRPEIEAVRGRGSGLGLLRCCAWAAPKTKNKKIETSIGDRASRIIPASCLQATNCLLEAAEKKKQELLSNSGTYGAVTETELKRFRNSHCTNLIRESQESGKDRSSGLLTRPRGVPKISFFIVCTWHFSIQTNPTMRPNGG